MTLSYDDQMALNVQDKLWFLKHINPKHVLDIGCGDGSVGEAIKQRSCNDPIQVTGVEPRKDARRAARKKLDKVYKSIWKDHWKIEPDPLGQPFDTVLLSSVLHESPSLLGDVAYLFEPDFIVIRDMATLKSNSRLDAILQNALMSNLSEDCFQREKNEEYFRWSTEKLLMEQPEGYRVIHFEHYSTPHTRALIERECGQDVAAVPTHVNVIYRKDK